MEKFSTPLLENEQAKKKQKRGTNKKMPDKKRSPFVKTTTQQTLYMISWLETPANFKLITERKQLD